MVEPRTLQALPSPWLRSISEAVEIWWSTLPVEMISKALDPYACPAEWLDYLAHTLSVDLWRSEWSELKKRDVIAQAPTLQTLKTTLPGLAAHLAIMDARIVQAAVPPGGFFFGAPPTAAEMEAWFATLPQVRAYFVSEERPEGPELIWGDGFWGERFWLPDLGPTIQRRKAVLFDRGVETPLVITTLSYSDVARKTPAEERVSIDGLDGPALLYGDGFWGVRAECAAALAEQRSASALDVLLAARDDDDARVRRAAARAFGAFREARSADRLLADIGRVDASWLVESERLRALGRTRDPRALDVLAAALPRASWGDVVRTAALDGLAAMRDARALPHLLAHLRYGVPNLSRRAALVGLASARELTADDAQLARIRDAVTDQLEDFDPNVAISAIVALRDLRHRSAFEALERASQRSLDGRVRRRAREALRDLSAALAGDAAVPALRDDLEKLREETRTLRDRLSALEARALPETASAGPAPTKEPGVA